MLNNAIPEAVENLLNQLLPREDFETCVELAHAAKEYGQRYLQEGEVRVYVSELLRKAGLNEAAIEAEALKLCAADVDLVHRMMGLKQARRDKNLLLLGEIRQGSLGCLQPNTDSVGEAEAPRLVDRSGG